jgi:hypothetical protein
MLFDAKTGFCNYFATAEVVMLRSIGIPARMAVGFAEGEHDLEDNVFTVRSLDAHAWPEVYFPDIGWIEFEPTGNQDALIRPNRPEPDSETENAEPGSRLGGLGLLDRVTNPAGGDVEEAEFIPPDATQPTERNPMILIAAALVITVALWGLNRQYAVVERLPARLQTMYERNGGQAPAWIINWSRWNMLTPIERAYQTINRCLRLLGENPAVHATPAERSRALARRLPEASRPIKTLVTQHQASLFSPQPGLIRLAKRASFSIWVNTFRRLFRDFVRDLDERFSGGRFA